jgi:hypothetical protein
MTLGSVPWQMAQQRSSREAASAAGEADRAMFSRPSTVRTTTARASNQLNFPIYLRIFELTIVVDGGVSVGALIDVTVGSGEGGEAGNSEEGEAEHS